MNQRDDALSIKLASGVLLLIALAFFRLHFVHLRADFPNHSPWMDWSKYTDEGWYGDAAIRHFLRGSWRLPGDFNPAVALPVWPLLEALVFRFTGVGIVAARALAVVVFGGILVCCSLLQRLSLPGEGEAKRNGVFAAAAVALLSVSSFLYCFTRMAIVEPLLILLTLLAILASDRLRLADTRRSVVLQAAGIGLLVALMIGTKTTAIFLLPAVWFMMLSSARWHLRRSLLVTGVAGGVASLLGGVYFLALVHAGLLPDFRYLFAANTYTGITAGDYFGVISEVLRDGIWMGVLIYPLALLIVLLALFRPRVWRDSFFWSLLLWAAGYLAFMAYHANFQPRYYLVVAIPLVLLAVRGAQHLYAWSAAWKYGLAAALLAVTVQEGRSTLHYVRTPEYTFQAAADRIGRIVESEPTHSHTVLSISGSNLSLMTGLPSICDDFGTMDLEDRIAVYKPGWFVTWNFVEDDKMEALAHFYRLTRVAALPAMDDPERNVMIVYRLDPKEGVVPKRHRARSRSPSKL